MSDTPTPAAAPPAAAPPAAAPAGPPSGPGRTALDLVLQDFPPGCATANAASAVLGAVPWGEQIDALGSLEALAGARTWVPAASRDALVAAARERAGDDGPTEALQVARALDQGDDVIDIRTGFDTALAIYRAVRDGESPLAELRRRQEADAVFKLLGLAEVTWRLFDGPPAERARALLSLQAGRDLVAWVGAAEIALPFLLLAPDRAEGVLRPLAEVHRVEQEARLAELVGRAAVDGSGHVAGHLLAVVDGVALHNARKLDIVAKVAGGVLEALATPLAGVRKAVSHGADALPVYRMLVARLVAEVCLRDALRDSDPEALLPEPPAELVGMLVTPTATLLDVLGAGPLEAPEPAPEPEAAPEPEPEPPPPPAPEPEPEPPPPPAPEPPPPPAPEPPPPPAPEPEPEPPPPPEPEPEPDPEPVPPPLPEPAPEPDPEPVPPPLPEPAPEPEPEPAPAPPPPPATRTIAPREAPAAPAEPPRTAAPSKQAPTPAPPKQAPTPAPPKKKKRGCLGCLGCGLLLVVLGLGLGGVGAGALYWAVEEGIVHLPEEVARNLPSDRPRPRPRPRR